VCGDFLVCVCVCEHVIVCDMSACWFFVRICVCVWLCVFLFVVCFMVFYGVICLCVLYVCACGCVCFVCLICVSACVVCF